MARMVTREQAARALEALIAATGITDQDAIAEAYAVIDRATVEGYSRESVQQSLVLYAEEERASLERIIKDFGLEGEAEYRLRHHLVDGVNGQTRYLAERVRSWLRDVPAEVPGGIRDQTKGVA